MASGVPRALPSLALLVTFYHSDRYELLDVSVNRI
jgi:hypothetical protein